MKIGGLERCSLIDYPGKVAAIVFTIGCNFRCPYCHNPELVDETASSLSEESILHFLMSRKGLLDAVTITGGEPTMHEDLLRFIRSIRALGFLVKLDTNGTNPQMLASLIQENLLDYIAMDIKAPLTSYGKIVGRPAHTENIRKSLTLLMESGVPYEFRTTVVRALLSPEDFDSIGEDIRGAHRYYLQKFVPTKILNPAFIRKSTYNDDEFERIRARMETYVDQCSIR
jgi:pyruvate formate lyase activating enzyme